MAIVFSDLHLNLWSKFNEDLQRTKVGFKVLHHIAEICCKKQVPALFCGDLFHKPEALDQDVALIMKEHLDEFYYKYPHFKVYAIEGNHDLKHKNVLNPNDPNDRSTLTKGWISFFENDRGNHSTFTVISPKTPAAMLGVGTDCMVHGVPYLDHNIGLTQYVKTLKLMEGYKHILLLHTDYPGAQDTDGRPVDSVENLNMNVLNRFDLVLCGHIHKPQRLGKKVYMIGAPYQQRRTDKNCKMGYWKLYSDLSMKFVPLKGYPKFIDVSSQDEVKDDGNYYTVIPQKASVEEVVKHKITKQLSKKKLAKRYMKTKGISDKNKESLLIKVLEKSEDL